MLVMKSGKRHMTEGVELRNQVIRMLGEKETLQILHGIGNWPHQTTENERKKKVSQKNQKITREKTL